MRFSRLWLCILLILSACGVGGLEAPAPGAPTVATPADSAAAPAGTTSTAFVPVLQKQDPTAHPRLWLTPNDLPRLRAWASDSNPLYASGLRAAADQASAAMDAGAVPASDCGGTAYEEYPTEMYAELFAFMSLVDPDPARRADFAQRARTLLMFVMEQAALGPASTEDYVCPATESSGYPPFRSPRFFTEDSDRARYHGEAFALVVDWIYPTLSASDKQTIRTVFLRWAQEIVELGYHHPEPVGLVNDPQLIADRQQVRWSGNNYFTAHMRNLGLLALALDPADDPGNQLRGYLDNATGAWLYIFDELIRTESAGGLLPEGFEYSPQTASYAAQFLLALHTAGADSCGPRCQIAGQPFWDAFVSAYFHSLSPATVEDSDFGTMYQPAWYGDAQVYRSSDFINVFGALGAYDQLSGNQGRLATLRWAEINTAPGGAAALLDRAGNPVDFRESILYFLLFDPAAAAPANPRPAMALDWYAPGMHKLLARTSWDSDATWLIYSLSWNSIDHQHADGNQFEWYRNGEWLTKARTGYANIAEGIASAEFRSVPAIQNDQPDRDPSDWRMDLWQRGSQWNLVAAGDPALLAHEVTPDFLYALGDATNLYNAPDEQLDDVLHASRSLVWLKPDSVVIFDRASTATANRFKRAWFQLPAPATISGATARVATPGGQLLSITSLLPANAALSAVNTDDQLIEDTTATNEPMVARLRIDAPGNPQTVQFLQVLQASDGVNPASPTLINAGAAWQGAQVADTAVLFPVALGQPFAGLSYATSATRQIITGLEPGAGYTVTHNGQTVTVQAGGPTQADSAGVLLIN